MARRVVTAEDIIRGALRQKRPRLSFPGLSHELNAQALEVIANPLIVRRGASPFVRDTLARVRGRR